MRNVYSPPVATLLFHFSYFLRSSLSKARRSLTSTTRRYSLAFIMSRILSPYWPCERRTTQPVSYRDGSGFAERRSWDSPRCPGTPGTAACAAAVLHSPARPSRETTGASPAVASFRAGKFRRRPDRDGRVSIDRRIAAPRLLDATRSEQLASDHNLAHDPALKNGCLKTRRRGLFHSQRRSRGDAGRSPAPGGTETGGKGPEICSVCQKGA